LQANCVLHIPATARCYSLAAAAKQPRVLPRLVWRLRRRCEDMPNRLPRRLPHPLLHTSPPPPMPFLYLTAARKLHRHVHAEHAGRGMADCPQRRRPATTPLPQATATKREKPPIQPQLCLAFILPHLCMDPRHRSAPPTGWIPLLLDRVVNHGIGRALPPIPPCRTTICQPTACRSSLPPRLPNIPAAWPFNLAGRFPPAVGRIVRVDAPLRCGCHRSPFLRLLEPPPHCAATLDVDDAGRRFTARDHCVAIWCCCRNAPR